MAPRGHGPFLFRGPFHGPFFIFNRLTPMEPTAPPLSPSDPNFLKGTLVLEAGEDLGRFLSKLENLWFSPGAPRQKIIVVCAPGKKSWVLSSVMARHFSAVEIVEAGALADLRRHVPTRLFAYLPDAAPGMIPDWDEGPLGAGLIRPWAPVFSALDGKGPRLGFPVFGWMAEASLFQSPWAGRRLPAFRDFEVWSRVEGRPVSYWSAPALSGSAGRPPSFEGKPPLTRNSRVLALVPHFQCEAWLEEALRSLAGQTRPPDGILVLDDASPQAPRELVGKFPSVTLWRAKENVGPYRLIQTAIDRTQYDAYLFQDADDWSSLDRLERTLGEAERTGAELIGTQELMYLKESVFPNHYPLEPSKILSGRGSYNLLHPSSLVSRDLVSRAGGYATGLRFSGDMEFFWRAVFVGKTANLDRYCYFRRIRMNSLITSARTGLSSPARGAIDERIKSRLAENQQRLSRGEAPLLEPLEKAGPVEFEEICGPGLAARP